MNEDILVSVIIPTFNRKTAVEQAVRSVLGQTFKPLEIIVVDDGSTDGTYDALNTRFKNKIRLFRTRHRGVSAARNKGVLEARGEWLAFLDSDDIWHKDKLQKQVAYLVKDPEAEIVQTDEIWIRHGKRVNPRNKHQKYSGDIFEQSLPLCIVTPSSVLMSKFLLERVGGFDEKLPVCEDYDLWLRIARDTPIYLIPEKLLTRHGGQHDQLSSKYWGMDRFRVYALRKLLRTALTEKQRDLVIAELKNKCAVLSGGALKRWNLLRWLYYRTCMSRVV